MNLPIYFVSFVTIFPLDEGLGPVQVGCWTPSAYIVEDPSCLDRFSRNLLRLGRKNQTWTRPRQRNELRMHQSLTPVFDEERCIACGQCVPNCPADALALAQKCPVPSVDEDRCIGCGECVSICPQSAVRLCSKDISDWTRGQDTICERMADYVVGLLDKRWQDIIHVLHLVDVTPLCDCVDIPQEPITQTNLGFLVGKNPFALDVLGARLITQCLKEEEKPFDPAAWKTAEETARYAAANYGITSDCCVEVLKI